MPITAGVVALTLAACSVPVPEPSETPGLREQGALQEGQSDRIINLTLWELDAADAVKDASLFGERVGEVTGQVRGVEYIVAAKGGVAADLIPRDMQAVYTTSSNDWPRAMVAVTVEPDATHAPVVLLWVQDSPQALYQFRAWAHMVPRGVLPAMPGQSTGTEQVALDADLFAISPQKAIEDYTAVLNGGAASELEATFAPDPYRQKMFEARKALSAAASPRGGTYTDTVTARPEESYVLADAEGGALLFVRLDVVSDFKVPGAQLALSASDKALLKGSLGSRVVYRYQDFIVIRIWGQGADALPVVVAADHHLVEVATS